MPNTTNLNDVTKQVIDTAERIIEQVRTAAGPVIEQAGPYVKMIRENAGPFAEEVGKNAQPYLHKASGYVVQGVNVAAENVNKATNGRFSNQITAAADRVEDLLKR